MPPSTEAAVDDFQVPRLPAVATAEKKRENREFLVVG
jgi:hypothetical protein